MTGEHELQSMDHEMAMIAQSSRNFLFAAIPVESWNDELSPWKAPAVWGKQGFGGKAADTLSFLTEQVIPTLKQRFHLPENVKIILGGYSLAGLFALWASTQTALFSDVAAASPSVWFPGWMEFEQQHPIQAQCIYLSLGDREERTKNLTMAAVGDNIRVLHSQLTARGADCTLEWNSGGHFKDTDLRAAKAFRWMMEEHT
jgi:predicted alpha/beta superfamily hydrolase